MFNRFIWMLLAPLALATPARADSWTGFYVGGAIGLGQMDTDYKRESGDIFFPFTGRDTGDDSTGASAGVLLGANQKLGSFVVGGEVNLDWADYTSGAVEVLAFDGGNIYVVDERPISVNMDWKATVMARTGVLVSDNLLAYGLIGFARAGFTDAPFETRNGVSFGGGLDWALDDRWSLRSEYRRTEFEGWNEELSQDDRSTFDASTDEFKMGVTYQFGSFY